MTKLPTFFRRLGRLSLPVAFNVLLLLCQGAFAWPQVPSNSAEDFDALAKSAAAAREANKADEAVRDYRQAVAIRPDWAEGWWYLGSLAYDADQYSDAIASFQKLVQVAPQLGAAWNFLGLCEFETADYEDALIHLEKGEALGGGNDPEIARVATYHLALLLIRKGEFDRAAELLGSVFGQQEVPAQIKVALGLALLRVPLLPSEVDPSKDALVNAAGQAAALMKQGEAAKASELLQRVSKEYAGTPYLSYAYSTALAATGQYDAAVAQLRQEASVSPVSALPWIEISALELQETKLDTALEAAEKAVQLAPDSPAAHQALAHSLRALGKQVQAEGEARLAKSLPSETLQPEARVAKLYSQSALGATTGATQSTSRTRDAPGLFQQAMQDYSSGRFSEAISALKTYVEQRPDDGTAWAVMGLSDFEMKDYDNALIHLRRGKELGFGGSLDAVQLARYRLGILLNRAGKFESATEAMTPVAESGPLARQVQFALGMALLRMPMLPEQVETSKQSLVQAAGEIELLLQNSKYDDAFSKFQALVKEYPSAPFLHYAYGTALEALSQFDEAEGQVREELKVSPPSALAYVRLASIALKRHRPADALPSAQLAAQLAADSAEAHYLLGRSYLELGQDTEAIHELEMASKLAPGSPEVHFSLAKAYARAKQPEKAEQERAVFVRLNTLAEQQRGAHGPQSYSGPRDAAAVSTAGESSQAAPRQ